MNDLNELIAALKQHLHEEEDLPLAEICPTETLKFYQKRNIKVPTQQKQPTPTPPTSSPLLSQPPAGMHAPQEKKIIKEEVSPTLPLPPPSTPSSRINHPVFESPSNTSKINHQLFESPSNTSRINHQVFKDLCQELFPELEVSDTKAIVHPQVILLHSPQIKDHLHTFLHKIAEAIRVKGIDIMLATPTVAQQHLNYVKLIIVDDQLIEGLPDFTKEKMIIPLIDIETLSVDAEKKKILWQNIRKVLGI